MAGNERLRKAMVERKISSGRLAEVVEVDPKTVTRWLAGRIPHSRLRWAVAEVLETREQDLWPGMGSSGHPATDEVVAAYARRADVPRDSWLDLIKGAEQEIGFLGYAMLHLPEQLPDLFSVLRDRAQLGCRVRIAFADPDSEEAHRRDAEEQLNGGLVARIRTSTFYFSELQEVENIELRFHYTPMYNSIFRFDDHMFVTPHLLGVAGSRAPLLHLYRRSQDGIFERFLSHFDTIWKESKPFEDRR
jgi:transcriptional regulator with XRE-family HTH domain